MNADLKAQALAVLRNDEGRREQPYDDATGLRVSAPKGTLTIGVGINLDEGLDDAEMDWLEEHRLKREWLALVLALHREHAVFAYMLPQPAQLGLALMCFQLGSPKVMRFHQMLGAIARRDWRQAAIEAKHSKWGRETVHRAEEVAVLFRSCIDQPGER